MRETEVERARDCSGKERGSEISRGEYRERKRARARARERKRKRESEGEKATTDPCAVDSPLFRRSLASELPSASRRSATEAVDRPSLGPLVEREMGNLSSVGSDRSDEDYAITRAERWVLAKRCVSLLQVRAGRL